MSKKVILEKWEYDKMEEAYNNTQEYIDKKNLENRVWYEEELQEYKDWNKIYLWFITIIAIIEFIILIIK